MDDAATTLRTFTPPELANFLAAQAVASATRFIDGRGSGSELARDAARIFSQVELIGAEPRVNTILDPTRLLLTSMIHTSISTGPRAERWADIMKAFVELLRLESTELARTGAQRQ